MPLISDPDLLVNTTDVVIDTTAKTIELVAGSAIDDAGAEGGVTCQALYSFLKEEWKTNSEYIKYPFPMEAITPEQFEIINGWTLLDNTTRKLIRTAGWTEKDVSGTVLRRYMGVISLGSLGATDQPYFRFGSNSQTNFTYEGNINEPIQIYGGPSDGDFDYTASVLTLFCREQGKLYTSSTSTAIGASTLTYIAYRFPLSNSADLNISAADSLIATGTPYTGISIEYFGTNQLYDIDNDTIDEPYRYVITDGLGTSTTQQIYEKIQWSLRYTGNIDASTGIVTGLVADSLLSFVGSTLVGENGVYIDNLSSSYLNSVDFYDFTGTLRRYPFVSAGTINFGANAGSGDFRWWAFHAATPSGNYGTSSGVIVNDNNGDPLSGTYNGSPYTFSFAYDSNTQGGRSASTDAAVTLVGIGLTGGQFASTDFTITRAQGISVSLSPAQERNYSNPA